jgi:hypothetical protein
MKQNIMHALTEEQKKRLVDAETMWSEQKLQNLEKRSERKSHILEKVDQNRIDEKSLQEE